MCSDYRFDFLDGVKVEGLCTCTCHQTGERGIRGISHDQNMADDSDRFEQARLVSWELHRRAGLTEDDYPQNPL